MCCCRLNLPTPEISLFLSSCIASDVSVMSMDDMDRSSLSNRSAGSGFITAASPPEKPGKMTQKHFNVHTGNTGQTLGQRKSFVIIFTVSLNSPGSMTLWTGGGTAACSRVMCSTPNISSLGVEGATRGAWNQTVVGFTR